MCRRLKDLVGRVSTTSGVVTSASAAVQGRGGEPGGRFKTIGRNPPRLMKREEGSPTSQKTSNTIACSRTRGRGAGASLGRTAQAQVIVRTFTSPYP